MVRALVGSAALAVLVACSGDSQKAAQNLASSAPAQVKEAVVAAAVVTKLATIDLDSASAVHVGVAGGTVTLTGQVRSHAVRTRFDAAARSIGGVRSVDDRTTLNPKLRSVREKVSDAALAARITGVLAAQTGVNVLRIKIGVRAGVVTLSGTVPSKPVKETMLESVRRLDGVRALIDRIAVRR